ncbi:sensor histidine kinase [Acrocarpospora phusangensis]|uniref:sensor histidine kinase n=1 Tax=Acrocarpospora phusangensis TaxID=1070424 RepID=UPI00194DE8CC|nr:nitrate- and nitrite sensing domain-containing protein [Acrocarpospora phusangensis]
MWGFVLNLTVGDGLALLRANALYETIGVTSTDLGLRIQEERALSADVLSNGQTGSAELSAMQAKTTVAVDAFNKAARDQKTRDSMSEELHAPLDSLLTELEALPRIRDSIALGNTTRLDAIKAYNAIMDELFRVYDRMVSVPDLGIFQQANAMQAMGNAHEMIAREDGLIRGALARGKLTAEEHNSFSEWVATRQFLYAKNLPVLEGGHRAPYEAVLSSDLFTQFQVLEGQIVNQVRSGGPLPAEAAKWKSTVDSLIVRLDDARIRSSAALTESATAVATGIMARIAVAGGVGLIAVVATIIFSVRFGRRLVRDLAGLRHAALELADVRLPRVVDRLKRGEDVDIETEAPPIVAGGSTEVEDVANAFSSVQRTAVEAAVGQANLRRGVNHVFLNLARRKQSLLHRQLTLLDSMQRRAAEPEVLEDLFRLDHLTTRMRRHAEGLIILSGAAPGRSWRKPVPIIDVVRAAVAEVEDFTRVTVLPMPESAVAGASVADLIHLVAELIENATVFSPPQTKVQVRAEMVANGLVLEVEDRGLGLSPEEYQAINEKLAVPPEFDLADSDRLGLFVVGQLAARYGIGVVLRSSPYGGTTAIVLVPRSLVAEDGSPAAIPPAPAQASRGAHAAPKVTAVTTVQATVMPPTGEVPDVDDPERAGPDTSPFFTPAALRTEPVPPAPRSDTTLSMVPQAAQSNGAPPALPSRRRSRPQDPAQGAPSTAPSGPTGPSGPSTQKPGSSVASGTHAGLPRRVRQSHIAPQLKSTEPEHAQPLSAPTSPERTPEEARAMFSAFQQGARRGREDADYAETNNGEKGEE